MDQGETLIEQLSFCVAGRSRIWASSPSYNLDTYNSAACAAARKVFRPKQFLLFRVLNAPHWLDSFPFSFPSNSRFLSDLIV